MSRLFEPKFKNNELVLVKYDTVYYEAKVIDCDHSQIADVQYKIHYKGWSSKCDEWLFEKRLRKINENKSNVGDFDHSLLLHFPNEIKKILQKDCENVKYKKLIIDIPRKSGETIHDILIHYSTECNAKNDPIKRQIINHIRIYFNEALSNVLLYENEREQHDIICIKFNNLAMDQIYGVEHLCRLFIKLPALISRHDLNDTSKNKLQEIIHEIMSYICLQCDRYFNNKV